MVVEQRFSSFELAFHERVEFEFHIRCNTENSNTTNKNLQ